MPTARDAKADALLDEVRSEARGQLKVFIGAAPGVGKTYAMLSAARELKKQGIDVVVGIAETHGRRETEALLEGLEAIQRRRIEYKGHALEELDLDALLARRPRVALVDELAHSNVPGSRHERRYQDIEELLDAGIDVYSTVNIQHLESLNDLVQRITGVRVRETVPDAFFDRARDVVLIDLPPRELIERLKQGKVYVPEHATSALQQFFTPSNLTALRELAVQTVADRVDSDLRDYRTAHGLAGVIPIRRRVLVAIDGRDNTEYLVRATRRIAERRQAPWTVAFVDRGGVPASVQRTVTEAFDLARRLGGETATLRGSAIADEIVAWAEQHGVSTIVVGRTRERPFARMFNRTITQQLLQKGAHFELTIVATPYARSRSRRLLAEERRFRMADLGDFGFAALASGLAIGVAFLAERAVGLRSPALIFVTAVMMVAVRTRMSAAVLSAVLCFLAYDFFFVDPRLSFTIARPDEVVSVVLFLFVALVVSRLAAKLRMQVVGLRAANEHTHALSELGRRLAAAADEAGVHRAGVDALRQAFDVDVVALKRGAPGEALAQIDAEPRTVRLDTGDLAAADWAEAHHQPAGRFTDTLSASEWWFLPLGPPGRSDGVVGLRFPPGQGAMAPEQERLAQAMVQDVAQALERTSLVTDLEAARVGGETDRLRAALLSSVSHDLRSPLASMIGATTSLTAYGDAMPASDRRELLDSILSEGQRLDRYIQNLLDMTRLGHGALKLERDWVGLDDIAIAALVRLKKSFPQTPVEVAIPGTLPLLYVHPALVEQALFNILENAAKFSPPGAPITVRAFVDGEDTVVDIVDRGPGIPEDERGRIFDMFYSVERGDRAPHGTGLGLAICQGMIGAHGGSVEALPGEDGTGTIMRIRLPIATPPEDEKEEP